MEKNQYEPSSTRQERNSVNREHIYQLLEIIRSARIKVPDKYPVLLRQAINALEHYLTINSRTAIATVDAAILDKLVTALAFPGNIIFLTPFSTATQDLPSQLQFEIMSNRALEELIFDEIKKQHILDGQIVRQLFLIYTFSLEPFSYDVDIIQRAINTLLMSERIYIVYDNNDKSYLGIKHR